MLGNGYLGVDFFFVLSGFIIAYSSSKLSDAGGGIRAYFRARLVRIYVPYLPIGIGLYVIYLLLPGLSEGGRTPSLLTTFTLLPSDLPPALSVAWTLVHELIFYVIFSLWFVSRRFFWGVMAVWVGGIVGVYVGEVEIDRFVRYFLSPLNLYFLLGVGIFMLTRRVAVPAKLAMLAAIAGVGIVLMQAMTDAPARIWVAAGFGLIVMAAASPLGRSTGVWRGFLSLGAASYAIYLVHNPVLSIAVRAVRAASPGIGPWTGLVVISVVALVAGLAYWRLYERPALRIVRQWLDTRGGKRVAVA